MLTERLYLLFQPTQKSKAIAIERLNDSLFSRVRGSNQNTFLLLWWKWEWRGCSSDEEDTVLAVIHDVLDTGDQGEEEIEDTSDEIAVWPTGTERKKNQVRRWRKKDFQPNSQTFSQEFDTPNDLKSPLEFFKMFYTVIKFSKSWQKRQAVISFKKKLHSCWEPIQKRWKCLLECY